MTAREVIRWASREEIDLNIRGGRLFVRTAAPIPPYLVAAIRAHKPAVIDCLEEHATNAKIREDYSRRCLPLTLTEPERIEADTLSAELAAAGTLGHFVCDLRANWSTLDARDQVAAVICWQLAADRLAQLERAA